MTEFSVSVRDLVHFCHRSGDIDHRFTPSPTGVEGIAGHQKVYGRRPETYISEYPVEFRTQGNGLSLLLRGRADGYDPEAGVVEEIKTCRVDVEKIPESVSRTHLAQARLYAAIIACQEGRESLDVRLTWFNIDTEQESVLSQCYSGIELEQFLMESMSRFDRWLQHVVARRSRRDQHLENMNFPLGDFRPGQRAIAELVYKCIDQSGQLMIEAPTGIGKTSAVLYPALKALATGKHDRIVFATAKTVGRLAAEQTLAQFGSSGEVGTVMTMSAKDRVCLSPGSACHGDDCPFARGYYDRLPQAMLSAIESGPLDRERIIAIANEHGVCPYQLSIDLQPWIDIIIADYHYLFSLTDSFSNWVHQSPGRWTVLVDEAHNLPGRSRGMFGARLKKTDVLAARRGLPKPIVKAADKINRALLQLSKEAWAEADFDSRDQVPDKLVSALQDYMSVVSGQLADEPALLHRYPAALDFYFTVIRFLQVLDHWGEEFRCELHKDPGARDLTVELNCLDPSRLLSEKQQAMTTLCTFSATLSPQKWCQVSLGLREDAVATRQSSPFSEEQLEIRVVTDIDTRYRQREASLPRLTDCIDKWLNKESGNCIVYFPSYRYMRDCLDALAASRSNYGGRELWEQQRNMTEESRTGLLALLADRTDVVAFCILGGVFGEGIDLPGDQLASVVIVGVGLPQFNRETEQLRRWHEHRHGQGFDFVYLYPGMQKVDQALGRVIRRESDRGKALLIDTRYRKPEYRNLLPPWWNYLDGPA